MYISVPETGNGARRAFSPPPQKRAEHMAQSFDYQTIKQYFFIYSAQRKMSGLGQFFLFHAQNHFIAAFKNDL